MFRRTPKPTLDPSWMIVGLGNPGAEFTGTRHNVGFEAIDLLASRYRIKLDTRKHQAVYGIGEVEGIAMLLVKPMTFMNLSGQAVKVLASHYKIPAEHIVVITDDLDLEPGRVRMKPHGGAGGHNGHRSIIASLGSDRYPRIKIGIGKPSDVGRDHVLSKFRPEERVSVNEAIERSLKGIEVLASYGIERAITSVNETSTDD